MFNKKIASEFALGIIIVLALLVGTFAYWQKNKIQQEADSNQQKPCTMEAKVCEDGSSVGRTGPNCEFAPCPSSSDQEAENNQQQIVGNDRDEHGCIGSAGYSWCEEKRKCLRSWEESCENLDWKTYQSNKLGIKFKYPQEAEISEGEISDFTNNSGGLTGKSISIGFKDDALPIYIQGYTSDYGTYFNSKPTLFCKNPLIYDSRGEVCYIKKFPLGEFVVKNSLDESECSIAFEHNIGFGNELNSEFKLIKFSYFPLDINKKIEDIYNCINDIKVQKSYKESVVQSNNIANGQNLSSKDRINLDIFYKIIYSIEFIK